MTENVQLVGNLVFVMRKYSPPSPLPQFPLFPHSQISWVSSRDNQLAIAGHPIQQWKHKNKFVYMSSIFLLHAHCTFKKKEVKKAENISITKLWYMLGLQNNVTSNHAVIYCTSI